MPGQDFVLLQFAVERECAESFVVGRLQLHSAREYTRPAYTYLQLLQLTLERGRLSRVLRRPGKGYETVYQNSSAAYLATFSFFTILCVSEVLAIFAACFALRKP